MGVGIGWSGGGAGMGECNFRATGYLVGGRLTCLPVAACVCLNLTPLCFSVTYTCKKKKKTEHFVLNENIHFLTRLVNDVILNYVFFVEIPLIQFGCLLLVCPLLCFVLPSFVVCFSSLT